MNQDHYVNEGQQRFLRALHAESPYGIRQLVGAVRIAHAAGLSYQEARETVSFLQQQGLVRMRGNPQVLCDQQVMLTAAGAHIATGALVDAA